ncbi:MAG: hypothetical protein ACRC67_14925, partial [Inquilinus sp.]|uniref:hypothetical protein n=1 Tax=Inquilinus sp. TaxID=1932117 RepID=UPI003F2DD74F
LLEACCAQLEGKTQRQKNPHPKGSLAYAAWVCARLGGWTGYYGKPGRSSCSRDGSSSKPESEALTSSLASITPTNMMCESGSPFTGEVGRPQDDRVRAGPGLDKIPSPASASRCRPLPQAGEAICSDPSRR